MSADPRQVMRILDFRGIVVRLEDGRLIGRCRDGPMPDDMISFIRYFRDLIVAELKAIPSPMSVTESEVA